MRVAKVRPYWSHILGVERPGPRVRRGGLGIPPGDNGAGSQGKARRKDARWSLVGNGGEFRVRAGVGAGVGPRGSVRDGIRAE